MGGEGDSGVRSEPDYEQLYVAAGDDLQAIPWAALAAHPALIAWLDGDVAQADAAALVVGCGFGDDAEALATRSAAVSSIAGTVRTGGRVFVRCAVRGEHEPPGARPWPVSRAELDRFTTAGLSELTFREDRPTPGRARTVTAVYEQRAQVPA